MNKKKEMTDFFEEHGPKRRARTLDWLDKRITHLEAVLTKAGWERDLRGGMHHMYNEIGLSKISFLPKTSEEFKVYDKKLFRFIRLAKLHNRYLSQYCDLRGMILNLV